MGLREREREGSEGLVILDDMMANISHYFYGYGVLIHHIDRDNLSDDEDEYPNNMVDQPSINHGNNRMIVHHIIQDDLRELRSAKELYPFHFMSNLVFRQMWNIQITNLLLSHPYSSNITHISP